MSRKISISKLDLQKLYVKDKLSSRKIAEIYNCHSTTILSKLEKFKINKRKPKEKILISKKELENLYLRKKFSSYKIASLYNCTPGSILDKLKEKGIKTRSRKRVFIKRHDLEILYLKNKLSLYKISQKFNCSPSNIFKIMNKYKIPLRKNSDAHFVHPKNNFSGDMIEKSYLIGFRIGDLNVNSTPSGRFIKIKCSTTKIDQIDLIKKMFSNYGIVWVGKPNRKGVYSVECSLNSSFDFLLEKRDEIKEWILNDTKYFVAFLAGYIDAEGNIGVYDGRARCRVGSYDKNILNQIHSKLNSLGVLSRLNLEDSKTAKRNGKFWRVSINSKDSLMKLFELIEPFLKHQKRLNDMKIAQKNILLRLGDGYAK